MRAEDIHLILTLSEEFCGSSVPVALIKTFCLLFPNNWNFSVCVDLKAESVNTCPFCGKPSNSLVSICTDAQKDMRRYVRIVAKMGRVVVFKVCD